MTAWSASLQYKTNKSDLDKQLLSGTKWENSYNTTYGMYTIFKPLYIITKHCAVSQEFSTRDL